MNSYQPMSPMKNRVFPRTPHQPSLPNRSETQLKGGGTTEQKWDTPLNRSGVQPEGEATKQKWGMPLKLPPQMYPAQA
ncbi:hypothetical protein GQ457_18G008140 [Hibiscus cannabinus]